MDYYTDYVASHILDLPEYVAPDTVHYERIMEKFKLEYFMIKEKSEQPEKTVAFLEKHDYGFYTSHIEIQARQDRYSRLTFCMRTFPGTCAWVVMYTLSHAPKVLKWQLGITEQLAVWSGYGAILVSQTQKYPAACVEVLEERGWYAHPYFSSGNPHSGNSKWLWFKALAAPINRYKGDMFPDEYDYPDTVGALDERMRTYHC
jgi:hypothetical protein